MPVMQPPTGPIDIADPNNVPELFVYGTKTPDHAIKITALAMILCCVTLTSVSRPSLANDRS